MSDEGVAPAFRPPPRDCIPAAGEKNVVMRFRNFRFKNFFGGLLFTIVPLAMIAAILRGPEVTDYLRWLRWTPTPCRIVEATEHTTSGNGIDRSVEVRYEYAFAGRTHGDVWKSDPEKPDARSDATITGLLNGFRPGTETVCRVNPDAPERSLLLGAFPWAIAGACVFISLFFFVGSALTLSCFGLVRDPATWNQSPKSGRFVGMAVGLVFMGVGFGFLISGWLPVLKRPDISGWVTTPCVVEASGVRTIRGNKGSRSYRFEARYAYDIAGKTYRTYAVLAGGEPLKIPAHGTPLSARFAPGTRTTCLTDPADPSRSALTAYPDDSGERIVLSFVLSGFALIGTLIFMGFVFEKRVTPSRRLQKVGVLLFIGLWCSIFVGAGVFADSIRVNGVRVDSPWVRFGFVAFGVGVAGVVLRNVWRRIGPETPPDTPKSVKKIARARKRR